MTSYPICKTQFRISKFVLALIICPVQFRSHFLPTSGASFMRIYMQFFLKQDSSNDWLTCLLLTNKTLASNWKIITWLFDIQWRWMCAPFNSSQLIFVTGVIKKMTLAKMKFWFGKQKEVSITLFYEMLLITGSWKIWKPANNDVIFDKNKLSYSNWDMRNIMAFSYIEFFLHVDYHT